jgi:hypothetical protein
MATKPTLQDSLTALKMFSGKIEPDLKYDVNGDGVVNLTDQMGLLKAYMGKDPGFAFVGDTFSSPSSKTAEEYAAEAKQNEERVVAEQKEAERRQALLADAQKIYGNVTADLVASNPNLNAQQLASLATRNYWANESEAFARVSEGMKNGTAQLKEMVVGYDESNQPITKLAITTGEHSGYDTLYLNPTPQKGVYQFSTPNQVAGGMINGVIQADPETGKYAPIEDYTKQVQYTPGQSGSFLGNMVGTFGDMYKSMGPIGGIIGNAIVPGLGSALNAVAALDEGNAGKALLSGVSAASDFSDMAGANTAADGTSLGNTDMALRNEGKYNFVANDDISGGGAGDFGGGDFSGGTGDIPTIGEIMDRANAVGSDNALPGFTNNTDVIDTADVKTNPNDFPVDTEVAKTTNSNDFPVDSGETTTNDTGVVVGGSDVKTNPNDFPDDLDNKTVTNTDTTNTDTTNTDTTNTDTTTTGTGNPDNTDEVVITDKREKPDDVPEVVITGDRPVTTTTGENTTGTGSTVDDDTDDDDTDGVDLTTTTGTTTTGTTGVTPVTSVLTPVVTSTTTGSGPVVNPPPTSGPSPGETEEEWRLRMGLTGYGNLTDFDKEVARLKGNMDTGVATSKGLISANMKPPGG